MEYNRLPNDARLFELLLKHGKQSRQNLATKLGLSIPTVSQGVLDLMELGLTVEDGSLAATGGRKARLLSAVRTARCAVGLDLTREHLTIALVDLAGEVQASRRSRLPFAETEDYFTAVAQQTNAFLAERNVSWTRILGVGISIPGIVSKDHQTLEYSHVLHVRQLSCESFATRFPCPCCFLNDAKAAAAAEFWDSEEPDYAVYLSLSDSVGGAIVRDGQIVDGSHHRAGEFGHMTLIPDGRQCYCGRFGCVDSYCNAKVLTQSTDGDLDLFFKLLHDNAPTQLRAWRRYEDHLCLLIHSLQTAFDCPVVLGGNIGTRMDAEQLAELSRAVRELSTFEMEEYSLRLCRRAVAPAATGAALMHIRPFLTNLGFPDSCVPQ